MSNASKMNITRHLVYVILMLLFYVIQSVPHLFRVYGVKPIWVVPVAVAIAMFEGEFAGGIYGAFAGLLCDTGGFLLFGFNGFVVSICCIAAGLLVIYLMRRNLLTCLLFVFVTLLLRGSLEYFFAYGMWQYKDARSIYLTSTLPSAAYSILIMIPVFYLIRAIHNRLSPYEEDKE